ncbi:MAG: dienelactone hydrolase family protein [Acetobacteraceae bacterium]|jgi:hypothetical protein
METFICHPERGGPFPAVLLLMDAPGIREELRDMTRRLGTVGYYALLPNLHCRAGRDTIYGLDILKKDSAEQTRMRAVRTKMSCAANWPIGTPIIFKPFSKDQPETFKRFPWSRTACSWTRTVSTVQLPRGAGTGPPGIVGEPNKARASNTATSRLSARYSVGNCGDAEYGS